ncbi:MAG: hypothetical protein IAI50_06115 [Candidatus Eremiobacteraeota bacterium]|nr:hypothetical protein [Candidatus Eremiobacteraeota bacterium]
MKIAIGLVAGLAITIGSAAAACADDLPDVTAKICSAAATVSSFVIRMSIAGTTGVDSQMTFVRPQRIKSVVTFGTISTETYIVDGTAYVHSPLLGWKKMSLDRVKTSAQAMDIASALKSTKVDYLPDRQENGTTVGVFEVASPLAGMTAAAPSTPAASTSATATTAASDVQPMTCMFDKSTYRVQGCANNMLTLTYTNYNDPANVVDLPADAKDATTLELPASTPAH